MHIPKDPENPGILMKLQKYMKDNDNDVEKYYAAMRRDAKRFKVTITVTDSDGLVRSEKSIKVKSILKTNKILDRMVAHVKDHEWSEFLFTDDYWL
jgi:hypothetical protein